MSLVPRLPVSAPFSSAQRAWLDGFLACLLTDGALMPPVMAETQIAEADDGDLPWHDPVLSLDERLELAAGRAPDRVLMAAMAQLDCGQCGYLC
ncbi:MAG TPA: hypothetical protein VG308_07480, partial [Stellaceae bacterium]|nr:hypothetical protein [Stellaceae bacterium]